LFKPATGFEDQGPITISAYSSWTSETQANTWAFCLALLGQKSPELAKVVDAWEALPEHIRLAVLALVATAK
jgi:hypothetical protein